MDDVMLLPLKCRSSSLGSSMNSRVVGHNSGLVLGIKDHICRVCPGN